MVLSVLLGYLGFIPTCLLFLMSYSRLLGEKRIGRSFILSLLITALLFVLFYLGLSIMLPRGVGIFREFALMLETALAF